MELNQFKKYLKEKNKKRNKYTGRTQAEKALTCKCNSDHIHNSRDEALWCNNVLLRKRAGDIKDFKVEVKYPLKVEGKHIANMYVDFEIEENDGTISIEEYKGFPTAIWKLKKKLFEALYPTIDYKVKTKADL